jgi:hypothetical protein
VGQYALKFVLGKPLRLKNKIGIGGLLNGAAFRLDGEDPQGRFDRA